MIFKSAVAVLAVVFLIQHKVHAQVMRGKNYPTLAQNSVATGNEENVGEAPGGTPVPSPESSPSSAIPAVPPAPVSNAPTAPKYSAPTPAAPPAAAASTPAPAPVNKDDFDEEEGGNRGERKKVSLMSTMKFLGAQNKVNLQSIKNDDFSKPLNLDNIDNGIEMLPTEFEYDLTEDNGNRLKLGNLVVDSNSFYINVMPVKGFDPKLESAIGKDEANQLVLVVKWPEALFKKGTLEVISKTGTVDWKEEITESKLKDWQEKMSEWSDEVIAKGAKRDQVEKNVLYKSQFGIMSVSDSNSPFWKLKSSFRFCLSFNENGSQTRFCSQRYSATSKADTVSLTKVKSDANPRVIVQSEQAPLKNVFVVDPERPLQFFAEIANGQTYEFISAPSAIEFYDMVASPKGDVVSVTGFGVKPIGVVKDLNPENYSSMTKLFRWQPTIGDFRKFWQVNLNVNDMVMYFPGESGGVFRQRFKVEVIPTAEKRLYLSKHSPTGTYSDDLVLNVRKQPRYSVASEQYYVEVDSKDPTVFEWRFQAAKKGQINRSHLWVDTGKSRYRGFYEVYKGYAQELSGRLTGIVTGNGMLLMGEVAYNHWFETLFGWGNPYLSQQRWGTSIKAFKALSTLAVSTNTEKNQANLDVMTIDLKYRFTPGLWGRDESHGLIMSYQSLNYSGISAPMAGLGWFWARSMPKGFNYLFNFIPFLRYDKWVDMELIYYLNSLNQNVTFETANYGLNFHGKVMWTQTVFGEAGFGIKQFGVTDAESQTKASLTSLYGTMGLGVNF